MATKFASVDEYIDSFPAEVRERLTTVRDIAREVVPDCGERISYGIPTVTLGGRYVVYYSAGKQHIALYPVPADEALAQELAAYCAGKGTLRFPLKQPLPTDVVRRVVAALAAQRERAG